MCVKKHTTIEEQILLLESRGCLIENNSVVKKILLDVNYYRISSYFLPFKKQNGSYIDGTSFNKVFRNYIFDRKLRSLLIFIIEKIEIALKTRVAYFHTLKYGPLGYLSQENYNQHFDKDVLDSKIEKYIKKHINNPVIKHHITKYNSKFPFWVIIEFFSFGDVSKIYSTLDIRTQKEIAKSFNTNATCMLSWNYCVTQLRNVCAHYSRVYNTKMISIPVTPKKFHFKLDNTLFSYLLIIRELLNDKNEWNLFMIQLESLIEEYQFDIELNRLGFPKFWRHILNS